ncbi:hypothetical protein [Syntrophorhabdus aromaticivorans]|uniref:hypothetical protein n=1 Tax=Syntrophorhabdus aromaticivorans TaxID=328301 RepID=UPI0012EC45E3|nr:hypothetical protein [Syntrophorhabdus aromaticivorans]
MHRLDAKRDQACSKTTPLFVIGVVFLWLGLACLVLSACLTGKRRYSSIIGFKRREMRCDHAPHVNADYLGGPSYRDAVGVRAALPYKLFGQGETLDKVHLSGTVGLDPVLPSPGFS